MKNIIQTVIVSSLVMLAFLHTWTLIPIIYFFIGWRACVGISTYPQYRGETDYIPIVFLFWPLGCIIHEGARIGIKKDFQSLTPNTRISFRNPIVIEKINKE